MINSDDEHGSESDSDEGSGEDSDEDSNEGIERISEDLDMVMACFSYTKYYLNLFHDQCLTEDWIYINAA